MRLPGCWKAGSGPTRSDPRPAISENVLDHRLTHCSVEKRSRVVLSGTGTTRNGQHVHRNPDQRSPTDRTPRRIQTITVGPAVGSVIPRGGRQGSEQSAPRPVNAILLVPRETQGTRRAPAVRNDCKFDKLRRVDDHRRSIGSRATSVDLGFSGCSPRPQGPNPASVSFGARRRSRGTILEGERRPLASRGPHRLLHSISAMWLPNQPVTVFLTSVRGRFSPVGSNSNAN